MAKKKNNKTSAKQPGTKKKIILLLLVILLIITTILVFKLSRDTVILPDPDSMEYIHIRIQEYDSLITNHPEDKMAYFYRGELKQQMAKKEFISGLETKNASLILSSNTTYAEAISDYDSIIKYQNDFMEAYFQRGNTKQKVAENKYTIGQKNQDEGMIKNSFILYYEAVNDYDTVIRYQPDYMLAYANKGMIYATMIAQDEKYRELAWENFDKAISLDPEYADNYYNKGWLMFISGDRPGACNMWRKAIDLGSKVAGQALLQNCRQSQ